MISTEQFQFRTISLCSKIYKTIVKIITDRLRKIGGFLIHPLRRHLLRIELFKIMCLLHIKFVTPFGTEMVKGGRLRSNLLGRKRMIESTRSLYWPYSGSFASAINSLDGPERVWNLFPSPLLVDN